MSTRSRPRIIARRSGKEQRADEEEREKQRVEDELDLAEELGSSVVVQGGVMMSVEEARRSRQHQPLPVALHLLQRERRQHITVEDKTTGGEPYVENQLPGIADEVESYPCKYCPDRVFLTGYGLEKHSRTMHKQHIAEVQEQIEVINEEWRRRESERARLRDRAHLARLRQDALTAAAMRQAAINQLTGGQEEVYVQVMDQDGEQCEQFEACRICGMLINSRHPTAMENHMRAHKKNDELRVHLLNEYGPELVSRLTCHECSLVFTDEKKLIIHTETMHMRKRKYVCKFCGHVCLSVTELNLHKSDIHAVPIGRTNQMDSAGSSRLRQQQAQRLRGAPAPALGARRRADAASAGGAGGRLIAPCRTLCSECGLQLVRPSLLIRHMLRAHSRDTFSADMCTRGMPPFRVDVDRGRVTWTCCEQTFLDRLSFFSHRRSQHMCHLTEEALFEAEQRPAVLGGERGVGGGGVDGGRQGGALPVQMVDAAGVAGSSGMHHMQVFGEEELGEGVVDGSGVYMMVVGEDGKAVEAGEQDQAITISAEQYEQLRLQYGDNLQVVFVDDDGNETAGQMMMAEGAGPEGAELGEELNESMAHGDALQHDLLENE